MWMIEFLSLVTHILVPAVQDAGAAGSRDHPAAASSERLASTAAAKAEAYGGRPISFRLALSPVSVGVGRHNHCPARDDHPVALDRLPIVLALEVALSRRSAKGSNGDPASDPRDESGQPTLGRTAHPW